MSILGHRVLRKEDPGILTGRTEFVADVHDPLLDDAVHVTYVRSTVAHARIANIDAADALAAPGVLGVFTATDLGLTPQPSPFSPTFTQCPLSLDVVRYVGEPVAVVVTERADQGEDAAERVVVDYEPLPAVVGVEAALAGDVLLFPEVGTNVCIDSAHLGIPQDDPDLFAGCDIVVSAQLVNQRLAPCPLEVRAAAAAWTHDGRLVHWATTQMPQAVQGVLAAVYAPPRVSGSSRRPWVVASARSPASTRKRSCWRASPPRCSGRPAGPRRAARACSRSGTVARSATT